MKGYLRVVKIIPLLICLLLPSISIAQSVKDVVRALKKVDAHCKTGINQRGYLEVLSDEAKENPDIASRIKFIMAIYDSAALSWEIGNSALVPEQWGNASELLEGLMPLLSQ